MQKTIIVYWSGTGNTRIMAERIKEGLQDAKIINVYEAQKDEVLSYDKIILGCPSMGFDNLEEEEFAPFFESIENKLEGKKIALFGSYGWSDGRWMKDWENRIRKAKGILFPESLTIYSTPNSEEELKCIEFGKKLADF